jgi:hypothetical protein
MIPAGYMAKSVMRKPDWLKTDEVYDIYSVSDCMSKSFADYINYWKHNGYWLFDSPEIIERLAEENSISLEGTMLFYYEVYELEYHEDDSNWCSFSPEQSLETNVIAPIDKFLEGFDIATFSAGTSPECSPLSCNSLAADIKTNGHCLIETFEEAKQCLESGKLLNSEPGPFRIFGVYSTKWP